MPATQNNISLPDADEWSGLTHPLSIAELNRLARLRTKIEAKEWLARRYLLVEPAEGGRLSFCKWMVATGRLSEGVA